MSAVANLIEKCSICGNLILSDNLNILTSCSHNICNGCKEAFFEVRDGTSLADHHRFNCRDCRSSNNNTVDSVNRNSDVEGRPLSVSTDVVQVVRLPEREKRLEAYRAVEAKRQAAEQLRLTTAAREAEDRADAERHAAEIAEHKRSLEDLEVEARGISAVISEEQRTVQSVRAALDEERERRRVEAMDVGVFQTMSWWCCEGNPSDDLSVCYRRAPSQDDVDAFVLKHSSPQRCPAMNRLSLYAPCYVVFLKVRLHTCVVLMESNETNQQQGVGVPPRPLKESAPSAGHVLPVHRVATPTSHQPRRPVVFRFSRGDSTAPSLSSDRHSLKSDGATPIVLCAPACTELLSDSLASQVIDQLPQRLEAEWENTENDGGGGGGTVRLPSFAPSLVPHPTTSSATKDRSSIQCSGVKLSFARQWESVMYPAFKKRLRSHALGSLHISSVRNVDVAVTFTSVSKYLMNVPVDTFIASGNSGYGMVW
eukprot:PhM_4_TR8371/c0_g1_i1/m.66044